MEQKEMIEKLKQHQTDALRELMDQYGTTILRFAYLLVKDHQLAEDISQETFLRAFQKIHQYKGTGSLKNWLLQIALNISRTKMRSSYFKRFIPKLFTENEIIDSNPSPMERSERQELLTMIHRLPHKYREVILLYYYQDMTTKEISICLKEQEGTRRNNKKQALPCESYAKKTT